MRCKWHTCSIETKNTFCSSKCKNKFCVQKKRMKLKIQAVKYKGGQCQICGYNKCIDAFDFHHPDSTQKDFGIGSGDIKSWNKMKIELDKCILLCANCHRETHQQSKSTQYILDELEREYQESNLDTGVNSAVFYH